MTAGWKIVFDTAAPTWGPWDRGDVVLHENPSHGQHTGCVCVSRFSVSTKLFHEVISYMVERKFRPYEIVDVLRRPLDGAMGQCDVLFVKEDHPLLADTLWSR